MAEEKKIEGKDPGVCPNCGSSDLEYHGSEPHGEEMKYPFTCNACGEEGSEWYHLDFIKTVMHISSSSEDFDADEFVEKFNKEVDGLKAERIA